MKAPETQKRKKKKNQKKEDRADCGREGTMLGIRQKGKKRRKK